jgi:hypothetical protein
MEDCEGLRALCLGVDVTDRLPEGIFMCNNIEVSHTHMANGSAGG